jgi:hypothetical protein
MASLTAHIALPAEFRESRNALPGPRGAKRLHCRGLLTGSFDVRSGRPFSKAATKAERQSHTGFKANESGRVECVD